MVSFEAFILDGVAKGYTDAHLKPLCEVAPRDYDSAIDIDRPDEVALLEAMLGGGVSLPHINKTFTRNFAWTENMIGVVRELYRKDLEDFGFAAPLPCNLGIGILENFAGALDPVDRFNRVFRHFALGELKGEQPASLPPEVDAWLDWVEDELQNPVAEQAEHIRRQADSYRSEDVAGSVQLDQATPKKDSAELPHAQIGIVPSVVTPAQAERIRRIYWQDYLLLGLLLPGWQERPLVAGLWIGNELPPLARLCILSFLHHGFRFRLHTYGAIAGIPEGVEIADANALLDASELYLHHTGSLAPTADRIRYRYLARSGGFWADLDMVCLDPGQFPRELPWFAMESGRGSARSGFRPVIR